MNFQTGNFFIILYIKKMKFLTCNSTNNFYKPVFFKHIKFTYYFDNENELNCKPILLTCLRPISNVCLFISPNPLN